MMIKLFTVGLVLLIGSIYFTRTFLKIEKEIFTIESLPLLETNEATADIPFSCEGKVEAVEGALLSSPYTNTPCVFYHSIAEKYVKRGKHSRWEIVENTLEFNPFYISDKRGKLLVDITNIDNDFSGYKINPVKGIVPDPDKSEIDAFPVLKHEEYSIPKKVLKFIPVSTRMRRSEYVLMPGANVFLYGFVSKRNNKLVVHEHEKHPLVISTKTKKQYIEEFYAGKNLIYLTHVLTSVGFTISLLSIQYFIRLNPIVLYTILYMGNAGIFGSIVFTIYNRMITLQQRARVALSNIDIELKRRTDLIPQIIELVKHYVRIERSIQAITTDLRVKTAFQNTVPVQTSTAPFTFLTRLENYPQLRGSENFKELMTSLVDTEDRIAYSRTFYNKNVRKLNTLILQFPFNIIGILFRIRPMKFVMIVAD